MDRNISIGEAEIEIMKVIWRAKAPVDTKFINQSVQAKGWKRTTVSTFLTRLVEKGALRSEKSGNTYLYFPLITEKEYRKMKTRNLIEELYEGSVKELTASLFEDGGLTPEDVRELLSVFDTRED